MNPNLHMNSGGIARDNDFSSNKNAQTNNHIYLQPGSKLWEIRYISLRLEQDYEYRIDE